ncbi:FUSC family protein [Streptomyces sp. NPDC060027]|uniref:FUSC family protein n=1 Tax=Streptomyces sp. NPDC060027 TaxID=3347040 RepID=UPI0036B909B5
MLRTFLRSTRRAPHFDPRGMHLRATAVTMATVLGTYGWALFVEREAGLRVGSVAQAVVIASALGRVQRHFDRADRLLACAVLPCAAAGGTELSALLQRHPLAGDAVFVVGVVGAIWVRRFGARATRAGTLVVLPLIAVLVVPPGTGPVSGHEHSAWVAVSALVAVAWGTAVTWTAQRTGLVPRPPSMRVTAVTRATRRRIPAGTRMALQMAAASTAAFAIGRILWPDHWAWVVLTAFLVCSGARSRGDVLVKGVWRTLGAAAGTVVADAVSGLFGPRSDTAVVVIFAVLAVATWLRELGYAYWAGGVTAVLSLFYDWLGQSPGDLLHTRLAGIAVGAVLGAAASWLVLPIRTEAVIRARTAAALSGLGDLMEADWHDGQAVRVAQARFTYLVEQLGTATAPMRILAAVPKARIPSARWRPDPCTLRPLTVVRRCGDPVDDLALAIKAAPDAVTADPAVTVRRTQIAAHAVALRRAIGRRPTSLADTGTEPPQHLRTAGAATPPSRCALTAALTALDALDAIDTQLGLLSGLFVPSPAPTSDSTATTAG